MFARPITRASSEVSAIHLASTSSEAGRRERSACAGEVGELDAVLAEQAAARGHVGDDRLVRVDQVGVGGAARRRRRRCGASSAPATRMKPRSRYIAHSSSFTQERSSSRARCSARRSRPGSPSGSMRRRAPARRRRASAPARPLPARHSSGSVSASGDEREDEQREQHGRRGSAAGGAREEDHPLGVVAGSRRSRGPSAPRAGRCGRRRSGTAAHMPSSSWRRNSSTSRSSSSRTRGSPSARRTSPWPGFMRRNLMSALLGASDVPDGPAGPRLWQSGRSSGWPGAARRQPSPTPSASTGPAPAPMSAQPVAHRLGGHLLAAPRRLQRLEPGASCAASAEEWVQPEPCAAPSGWRSPGISTSRVAVEEDVRRLLAVAAGDHHRAGPEGVDGPGQARSAPASLPAPGPRASARFGVTTVARGTSRSRSASRRPRRAARAPLSATITGSSTTGRLADQVQRLAHRLDRLGRPEHPDLHRVDADVARPPPGPARRSPPAAAGRRR